MDRIIRLSPLAHLPSIIGTGEIAAFNAGSDGRVYIITALKKLDYKIEQPGWAVFPKTIPDQPQQYRVVALSEGQPVLDVVIEQERFNIHDVQPLGDQMLLVCSRSHYRGPDDYEKNGRIYNRDGKLVREILLGDGIQSVQTTSDKVIWTSFFDEGVFGNYDWEKPVGASGLVAWDSEGNKLHEFEPIKGLDPICDCYALNAESNEDVWLYYYTEFPLVHLHNGRIKNHWKMPITGSGAFAVSGDQALFCGGYDDRDLYYLFCLQENGQVEEILRIELRDHHGNKLLAERVVARSDAFHLVSGEFLYRFDMKSIIEDL